ncbi:MAG: hypothetical protein AB9836_10025 [Aminipila sp.]
MIIERSQLNDTQRIAYDLIKYDLSYLYTLINMVNPNQSNFIPSIMPYLGVIIDGAEDWIVAVNKSKYYQIEAPIFTEEEQEYYEPIRSSIKMWEQGYDAVYHDIESKYIESDNYLSGVCKPIAKKLNLYDIYGMDLVNEEFCGNTILCAYYAPFYTYNGNNGQYIRDMSMIGGRYIHIFDAINVYSINTSLKFNVRDYGGVVKSPVGNQFSHKFLLLSMLCQINFVLYCVDKYIIDEIPTKLRLAYILYYYLLRILPDTNRVNNTSFLMDHRWDNRQFRNAMAHYKVGVVLKPSEIILDDPMCGLTQKILDCDYITVKCFIIQELKSLAVQIKAYLKL